MSEYFTSAPWYIYLLAGSITFCIMFFYNLHIKKKILHKIIDALINNYVNNKYKEIFINNDKDITSTCLIHIKNALDLSIKNLINDEERKNMFDFIRKDTKFFNKANSFVIDDYFYIPVDTIDLTYEVTTKKLNSEFFYFRKFKIPYDKYWILAYSVEMVLTIKNDTQNVGVLGFFFDKDDLAQVIYNKH